MRALSLGLLCAALVGQLASAATPAETPEFFETKIRPVFARNCFACHTKTAVAGLRMDSREALLKGGQTGPSIVPGDPEKSLLVRAIHHTDELKMPKGGKLKPQEIEDIAAWVKAGAPWPATAVITKSDDRFSITPEQRSHWAFRPLQRATVPQPKDRSWVKTDIDRFIRARLEAENLKPVAPADKRALLRRVTFDLTGLPAKPEEVEAFLNDKSPDAFPKVVDRLLASSHYGERWGRHWLDVAHYGEDDPRGLAPMLRGYMPYQHAYLYRDWVVKAINDDMPFDLFAKAQLAADQLDSGKRASLLPALGFLGQAVWTYDVAEPAVARAEERNDRVDLVTRGFLGVTVACARCHDHKYDPVSQKDYHALSSVFYSTAYHEYPQVPKSVVEEYTRKEKAVKEKERLMGAFLRKESEQVFEVLAHQTAAYMMAAYKLKTDDKLTLAKAIESDRLDYELLERWVRFLEKAPKHYPDLKAWQAMLKKPSTPEQAKKLAEEFQRTLLTLMGEQKELKEENDAIFARSGLKRRKERPEKPHEFETMDDFCNGCGLEYKTLSLEKMNLFTDVFVRDLDGGDEMSFERIRPGLLAFRGMGMTRFLSADRALFIEGMRKEIETMRKDLGAPYPYVHGVADLATSRNVPLAIRGNPANLGEEVPRRFLSVLTEGEPKPFTKGSGRLELAEAITKHPLFARVIVNRVWKWHFGTGLVESASNFGFAGERPSNPELLEHLASRFVDQGYSLKKLQKEILLSATYQLGSAKDEANFAKDGANRLHWRFNRQRLSAEQVRDSMLQVSGVLEPKLGGPSEDLAQTDNKRRTLYGKVSRYRLNEFLQAFDFPNPNITAEGRFATNVPGQQLFFLNSEFVQRQAEALAKRVATKLDDTDRIREAYRLLFQRAPSAEEVKLGLDYLAVERTRVAEERLKKLAEPKPDDKSDAKPDTKLTQATPAPAATDAVAAKPEMPKTMPNMPDVKLSPMMEEMLVTEMTGMDGMMGMVKKAAPVKKDPPKRMEPPTPWGRYARVLLASSEFRYID